VADRQQPRQQIRHLGRRGDQHAGLALGDPVQDLPGGLLRRVCQELGEQRLVGLDLGRGDAAADHGVLGDPGADAAGMHRGHADPVVGQLGVQHLAEPAQRELAGAVGRLPGRRDQSEQAGHVDQVRARRGLQRRQQRVGQQERRPEVDVHDLLELVHRDLVEAAAQRHAGVVDQQAERGVLGEDLGGHTLDVGTAGQVGDQRLHGATRVDPVDPVGNLSQH
jgi:hypothetical protein